MVEVGVKSKCLDVSVSKIRETGTFLLPPLPSFLISPQGLDSACLHHSQWIPFPTIAVANSLRNPELLILNCDPVLNTE